MKASCLLEVGVPVWQRLYLSLLHPRSPSFPSQTAQGASRCSCIPFSDTASLLTGVCSFPSMDKDLGEHNQAGSPHFPAVMPPCPVAALGLADGTAGASSLLLLHPSPSAFLPFSSFPALLFHSSFFSLCLHSLTTSTYFSLLFLLPTIPLSAPPPSYLGGDQYTGNAD